MFRLIIADDHPAVLQAVKQLLQEEFPSAHIGEATDTKTLLDMALNQPWDLVITDLAMPGEGGFAALKKIKQAKKNLPVIILSTYPAEQYLVRVLQAGAEDFVAKDSLPGGLVEAIRNIFKHKK
ncbi:MAG TPA: response regulator transcription factor [Chitinophagaceae bacterium]|nr:response regulator transcription factor [Chitinophagaceae bacterium]